MPPDPVPPPLVAHIYRWAMEAWHDGGVSYASIDAWSRLSGHVPTPREAEAMVTIGRVVAKVSHG